MSTLRTIQGAAVGAALTLVGCGREKEAETPSTPAIQGVSTGAVRTVPTVIENPTTNAIPVTNQSTAQGSTEVLPRVPDVVTTNLQAGASAALDRAQDLLDAARKRIDEKKWNEALSLLEQLTGQPLTPDEATTLRNLRDQIKAGVQAAAVPKIGQEINRLLEDSKTPR